MSKALVCLLFILFAFVVVLADYGQEDKYREGKKDCQMYQLLNHTNCPL